MTSRRGCRRGISRSGGSIVCDEVAEVVVGRGSSSTVHLFGHPVAAAFALENLRIMQEEHIVEHVRDVASRYCGSGGRSWTDNPMVGEAKLSG